MTKRNRSDRNNKRLLLITAEILLVVLLVGVIVFTISSSENNGSGSEDSAEYIEEAIDESPHTDEVQATLFFASDYQEESGWPEPSETLGSILDAVSANDIDLNGAVLCGDYSNEYGLWDYQISPDSAIEELRSIIGDKYPSIKQEKILFVQGNHDALTDSISDSGLHEFDDYLIYVLNTQNDFPWSQGKTSGCLDKVKRSSKEMEQCLSELIEAGETRPVIIAAHVPLHYSARTSSRHSTGDNLYSSLIFDVVNEAAKSLDIIYLFGHNHSKGWDCYMGGSSVFKSVGDELLIPRFAEHAVNTDEFSVETLNFTYFNAGYVGYYMNCGPNEVNNGTVDDYSAADETLTGTVCEIKTDEIVISRYSSEGLHQLSSQGEANPYKNMIDTGLIGSDYYSTEKSSPISIERKNAA